MILLPAIGIVSPGDPEPLREAVAACGRYDWILFSSVNAVEAFACRLTVVPRARIATVGEATRDAAERRGLRVSVTPDRYVAEALVDALGQEQLSGKRVLIPSAAVTRDVIAPALRKLGAQVDVVEAYRNEIPADTKDRAAKVFREPLPDWITFASSSAVTNLVSLVGVETLKRLKIASIGPATSATLREHGLEATTEASEHTTKGLVKAVSSC